MSTALAQGALPTALAMPAVDRIEGALLLAAERSAVAKFPTLAQIEEARGELVRAIETRPPLADVRKAVARLMMEFPQSDKSDASSAAVYVAALTEEAATFPADVLAAACRHLRRTLKFRPSVAELVEACDAGMERRRRLLRGADALKAMAQTHERDRAERSRIEAERAAYHRKVDAAMVERWGSAVPEWWSLDRAWRGASECRATGRLLAEAWAAAGDGPSWVYLRRAALYALARDMETATFPGRRRLVPADLAALAGHLCRDEDAAALALIEAPASAPGPEDTAPPSRLVIGCLMRRVLSFSATVQAARTEGLFEMPDDGAPPPIPDLPEGAP